VHTVCASNIWTHTSKEGGGEVRKRNCQNRFEKLSNVELSWNFYVEKHSHTHYHHVLYCSQDNGTTQHDTKQGFVNELKRHFIISFSWHTVQKVRKRQGTPISTETHDPLSVEEKCGLESNRFRYSSPCET